ncbi:MAG: Flp pilus assembly protein CpaB [Alphaproteobacteria bacterium]
MRPVTIVLLVVALFIAGSAAFLVKRYLANQSAASEAAAMRSIASKHVLVAAVDMPMGHIVGASDIRWQEWPEALVNPNYVTRSGGEEVLPAYQGAVVRTALTRGEPVQASRLFRQEGGGLMAGLLSPGMRAVSVDVTPEKGVSGFILPGDHVDVVLTHEIRGGDKNEVSAHMMSESILRDIRVLAVDQTLTEPKEGSVKAKNVTLEVTAKQAEMVALALRMGTIALPLRSLGRPEGVEEPLSYTTDLSLSVGMRDVLANARRRSEQPEEAPQTPEPPPAPAPSGKTVKVYRGGSAATATFDR